MTMDGVGALHCLHSIPTAAFAYAQRFHRSGSPAYARFSAATGVTMLATMGLAGAGFNQAPGLVDLAGLCQRAAIVSGFAWLTALSARALHR